MIRKHFVTIKKYIIMMKTHNNDKKHIVIIKIHYNDKKSNDKKHIVIVYNVCVNELHLQ